MVLGARTLEDEGCVLVYEGKTPDEFEFVKKLSIPDFGYMWECPDYFTLEDKGIIIQPTRVPLERFKTVKDIEKLVEEVKNE